ncbi:MAG: helix-turn-helix domain-containing protein [Candidatus Aminicenantales bacterium]
MPPLRKRVEDIPILVSHFLQKHCRKMDRKMKRLTPEVIGFFESYSWPGNVRELENVIERLVAVEDRETITAASLPVDILATKKQEETRSLLKPGFKLEAHLDEISKKCIQEARVAARGNMRKTATLLGIRYRSLRYLVNKYNMKTRKKTVLRREARSEVKAFS